MRIISGIHRGRNITAPKKLPVRPTTDRAKEALFNILHNRFYFPDLRVLDLFAGTGNIAYEFASRGVGDIVCVDRHMGCIKFIEKTATQLQMPISPLKKDVFSYLEQASSPFDIVFADPPYDMEIDQLKSLSENVFERELLKEDGFLVIEHSKHTDLSLLPHFWEARNYGGRTFSFFVPKASQP
ncbi:MAG: RsmD family RNA methyltransferase [Flavobacteriaceae bacterium]